MHACKKTTTSDIWKSYPHTDQVLELSRVVSTSWFSYSMQAYVQNPLLVLFKHSRDFDWLIEKVWKFIYKKGVIAVYTSANIINVGSKLTKPRCRFLISVIRLYYFIRLYVTQVQYYSSIKIVKSIILLPSSPNFKIVYAVMICNIKLHVQV